MLARLGLHATDAGGGASVHGRARTSSDTDPVRFVVNEFPFFIPGLRNRSSHLDLRASASTTCPNQLQCHSTPSTKSKRNDIAFATRQTAEAVIIIAQALVLYLSLSGRLMVA